MLFRVLPRLLLLLFLSGACGCDSPKGADLDEQKNPHFIEGKDRTRARDYKGAIEAFQRALDANPNSALAHFELGMLYEKHDEDNEWRYVLALYHYYRAYELRPNAYPADNAKVRIQACRQELAKTESLAPLYPAMQRDLEKLREENSQLRRQVEFLQTQVLGQTVATSNRGPVAAGNQLRNVDISEAGRNSRPSVVLDHEAGTPGSSRKHTVKERETFASIARTYKVRVDSVLAANPGIEPKRLRPGQTVNIPSS